MIIVAGTLILLLLFVTGYASFKFLDWLEVNLGIEIDIIPFMIVVYICEALIALQILHNKGII